MSFITIEFKEAINSPESIIWTLVKMNNTNIMLWNASNSSGFQYYDINTQFYKLKLGHNKIFDRWSSVFIHKIHKLKCIQAIHT